MFALHGYKRVEALSLPVWEFWAFAEAVVNREKKAELQRYQTLLFSSGGGEAMDRERYIRTLMPLNVELVAGSLADCDAWTKAVFNDTGDVIY